MTRLADDRTNASSSPSTSSRGCGFRDELNATFNALYEEMRLLSDHDEEMNPAQKKTTTLVKKNFDSNASSNSSKTRKESIEEEEDDDDEEEELVAKTSYVLDVASLEESDALKIARLRERQQKDFEIERLKRIVKMLCEQKTNAERRRKDDDVDATDVLSEYDKELKTREKIIEELREELNALKKSASDRIDRKFRASSSSPLESNAAASSNEEIVFLRRELRKSELARDRDSKTHLDLCLREKRVSLREKSTSTRDKRLAFLETERAKILRRATTAETNVSALTSALDKAEKRNQRLMAEQLRKRDGVPRVFERGDFGLSKRDRRAFEKRPSSSLVVVVLVIKAPNTFSLEKRHSFGHHHHVCHAPKPRCVGARDDDEVFEVLPKGFFYSEESCSTDEKCRRRHGCVVVVLFCRRSFVLLRVHGIDPG